MSECLREVLFIIPRYLYKEFCALCTLKTVGIHLFKPLAQTFVFFFFLKISLYFCWLLCQAALPMKSIL